MKKTALIFAFALCLGALCGCGDSSSSSAPAANSSSAAASEASVAQSAADSSTADDAKGKYAPCTKNGSVYESPTANLKFTLPEGWAYLTDEEILKLNQKKFGYETIEEMVSKDKMIMDAAAWKDGSYPRITIQFSNNSSNGLNEEMTTKEIAEKSQKAQAGKHTTGEVKSFTLDDGAEYMYFTAQEEYNLDGSEKVFYNTSVMRTLGRYTLLIQYSGFENDFETAILPNFACVSKTPQE